MQIFPFFIFLSWGSFLNSLAYRLVISSNFFALRSFCPSCKHQIAWYDNIPVISWLLLNALCRHCKQPICILYPIIELMTAITLYILWQTTPIIYFPAYFFYTTALIITIRTDFQTMLISRYATIYLIPIFFLAAYYERLPLDLLSALQGAIFGYGILLLTKLIAEKITEQPSLGQGDLDLLAFIGSATGIIGSWIALLFGSIVGSCCTLLYMRITKSKIHYVSFGGYIALAAIIYLLIQQNSPHLINLLL